MLPPYVYPGDISMHYGWVFCEGRTSIRICVNDCWSRMTDLPSGSASKDVSDGVLLRWSRRKRHMSFFIIRFLHTTTICQNKEYSESLHLQEQLWWKIYATRKKALCHSHYNKKFKKNETRTVNPIRNGS